MARSRLSENLASDTIKAARKVIKKEGLNGLDVRKVAKEAGYSIGTFYNNFKSLDDLVVMFNSETLDLFQEALLVGIEPEDTTKKIIEKLCGNYIEFAKHNPAEWILLFEYHREGVTPEHYTQKVDKIFGHINKLLHPHFGGTQNGIKNAIKVLWSSLHGICSLTLRNKLEGDPLDLCLNLVQNYATGYRVGIL